jgi:hypothetical protein
MYFNKITGIQNDSTQEQNQLQNQQQQYSIYSNVTNPKQKAHIQTCFEQFDADTFKYQQQNDFFSKIEINNQTTKNMTSISSSASSNETDELLLLDISIKQLENRHLIENRQLINPENPSQYIINCSINQNNNTNSNLSQLQTYPSSIY